MARYALLSLSKWILSLNHIESPYDFKSGKSGRPDDRILSFVDAGFIDTDQ